MFLSFVYVYVVLRRHSGIFQSLLQGTAGVIFLLNSTFTKMWNSFFVISVKKHFTEYEHDYVYITGMLYVDVIYFARR